MNNENGRKLENYSNFRPLSESFPAGHGLDVPLKVPFLLGLLVIHLKHPLWLPLLKYIFTPEFLRKAQTLFAKSDELVTKFSAEV
jgi:hypothetical protein